jgi:hypothetical protein
MLDNYKTEPSSVHDCPRLYKKDGGGDPTLDGQTLNTCAIRFTEGLVLALGLAKTRQAISKLTSGGGSGSSFMLGKYGYKAKLCPHGIGRGAADVAYFLTEQWGRPTYSWKEPSDAPKELVELTGALAFIKIPGYGGQGHMDVWNKTSCVGHGYFNAQKVLFWRLD